MGWEIVWLLVIFFWQKLPKKKSKYMLTFSTVGGMIKKYSARDKNISSIYKYLMCKLVRKSRQN